MTAVSPATRHVARIVSVQAHVSGCMIVGGLLFGRTGFLLIRPTGDLWLGAGIFVLIAAGLALAIAILPWLWPSLTILNQRLGSWSALTVAVVGATWAIPVVDAGALVGVQAILAGLLLAEVGGRRHALRWFWFSVVCLTVAVLAYWWFIPLRLTAE